MMRKAALLAAVFPFGFNPPATPPHKNNPYPPLFFFLFQKIKTLTTLPPPHNKKKPQKHDEISHKPLCGPPPPAKKLNACTTCHLPNDKKDPQNLDEFPHNPFGARLRAAKKELAAQGGPTDIPARIALIANEDSDQDGVDNLTEILLGRGPGDAS